MTDPTTAGNRGGGLLPAHLADLARSGLTAEQAAAAGLYSETDPAAVSRLLGWDKPAAALGPALVFPYLDASGRPTGYARLKPTTPRADKKSPGRAIKYEAPRRQANRAYVPPGTRGPLADPAAVLILTEGEKKSLAADAAGFPCVGLPGVWAWQRKRGRDAAGRGAGPRELIPDLAGVSWSGRAVRVVFDSDAATNPNVRAAEGALAAALTAAGAVVKVVRLPVGPDGRKQGLDDFLLSAGPDGLRDLLAVPAQSAGPSLPHIVLGPDEHRANAAAAAALGTVPDLYQRGGLLVRVVPAAEEPAGPVVRRPCGAPAMRVLPAPLVREEITRAAVCVREVRKGEELTLALCHPPAWMVNAVHVATRWPGVRELDAVVGHPVLRPDGTVLAADGYDPETRLLVAVPHGLGVRVPPNPTAADAARAAAFVLNVVGDFPFESPAHRSAWLAGLLTPLAWFAFDGPAPLFLIDGNVRGVGKGLLADVIGLLLTGRRFPVMSYTNDREELRKKVTTLAAEGERLVLLDNLAGSVGNDVLDMALTADRWKDRLLGTNREYDGPLHVCWFGTGNNVQLQADTARRVCHVRLETPDERPEDKGGFRYPDLRAHVLRHRGELLTAAITILRAWHLAGRPHRDLPPWGSYEGWSGVVRAAVVFADLPDPGQTRLALQTQADRDAANLASLMGALERLDPSGRGLTAAELIDLAKRAGAGGPEAELKAAAEELCGKLDSRALGCRLRHFRRRTVGGRVLDQAGADRTHAARWVVRPRQRPPVGGLRSPDAARLTARVDNPHAARDN